MKKIKVAFFAEMLIEDFDGAARTMFQIIKRINPNHFEFLFFCGTGPEKLYGFDCIRVPTIAVPLNSAYKMAVPALAARRIKSMLEQFAPDVIHIATPSILGNFALKLAYSYQIPVISVYHTHFISYVDYYLRYAPFLIDMVKPLISENQKSFYNQCDIIYVPAESIAADLRSMNIEGKRLKIWKRGLDTSVFSPERKNMEVMKRITGNSNPTILFASRLVWEKNLETLITIYTAIRKKNVEVNFLIAGDGVARKACEKRMPTAIFVGKLEHAELSVLYASADIFLFPSISETYGNVVLEAMSSGLPCIVANGGGSADFIEQGMNGFKCSPQDADDYLSKIQLLLADESLRRKFAEKGLAQSKNCNWEQLTQIYFNDLVNLSKTILSPAV
ncbi:glycosyltransferase involved in cell wall biosynthesis [Pedobacter sp. CAN_A7]|uniref:glycosyltransferase family 4 protein n=1 Tax=Pedobacter sp. CAN_A7 TaxID=2787722 RepID=UPI0018CAAF0D